MRNRKHIVLAIVLLLILGVFGAIIGRRIPPRIDLPFDIQSTTLAAQFAYTPVDINAVFGSEHRYAKQIEQEQYWDFFFIPCYVALFVILALALRHYDVPAPRWMAWSAVAAAVAAGALDVAENIAIISVARNPNAITSNARYFALPKWGLVFLVLIVESAVFFFWPRLTLWWRIAAVIVGGLFLFTGTWGLLVTALTSIHEIAIVTEWLPRALGAAFLFLAAWVGLNRKR